MFRVPSSSRLLPILALAVLVASCRGREGSLSLPSDPPLSGGLGWALVKVSYLRLLQEPVPGSSETGLLRDGAIVEISARSIGSGEELAGPWYLLSGEGVKGWAPAASVSTWKSREQARNAAGKR